MTQQEKIAALTAIRKQIPKETTAFLDDGDMLRVSHKESSVALPMKLFHNIDFNVGFNPVEFLLKVLDRIVKENSTFADCKNGSCDIR